MGRPSVYTVPMLSRLAAVITLTGAVLTGILSAQELVRSAEPDYSGHGDQAYTVAPVALELTVGPDGIPDTLTASEAELPGGIPANVVAALSEYRFRPGKSGFRAHLFVTLRHFAEDALAKPVKVAPSVMEKRVVRREAAVARGNSSAEAPETVVLVAHIDASGRVVEANLRRGAIEQFEQARAIALGRVYQPTFLSGQPVSVLTEIQVQVAAN